MKHIVFFFVVLLIQPATLTAQKIQIRGSELHVPVKLKVKIRDIENTETLVISGVTKGGEGPDFFCKFTSILERVGFDIPDFMRSKGWQCKDARSGLVYPITQNLTLSAGKPLTRINDLEYRGQIQFVRNGDRLMLINQVDMEDYLVGLVNKEINSKFPAEAIKAQAIAARSYAMATVADRRKKHRLYDLLGTEVDQVYEGASFEDHKSRKLVEATKGEVLVANNDVLKAYYHAASGGHLEDPSSVWLDRSHPVEMQAYIAKPSPVDEKYAPSHWSIFLSPSIGLRWADLGKLKELRILERSSGQRVKKILLVGTKGQKIVGGAEFRKMLGNRWLKSTLFSLQKSGQGWQIEGRGFGHGVGMSQMGAKFMAKNGQRAEDILNFYYPKAKLQKIY